MKAKHNLNIKHLVERRLVAVVDPTNYTPSNGVSISMRYCTETIPVNGTIHADLTLALIAI